MIHRFKFKAFNFNLIGARDLLQSILKEVPWRLIVFLFLLELFCLDFYPYQNPYFVVLLSKAPLELGMAILCAIFRGFLGYTLLLSLMSLLLLILIPKPSFQKFHTAALCMAYSVCSRFIFQSYSPSGFHLKFPLCRIAFSISLFLFGVALLRKRPPTPSFSLLSRLKSLLLLSTSMVFLLLMTAPRSWETSPTPKPKVQSTGESIFFLSFDAVPGDLFRFKNNTGAVMPEWQQSRKHAMNYTNAYSVTNSTYTSWFSILSGLYPWQSQVETLYPVKREGTISRSELLPELLKQKGYQTVFMTDCATTSSMHPEFGFERLYQLDKGAFKSTQIVLTALHPLIGLFQWLPSNFIFPEINSYSSPLYAPESFFKLVRQTLKELEKGSEPYFLAVHSCLTHRDLTQHLPSNASGILNSMPFEKKDERTELVSSLRWADANLKQVFKTLSQVETPPWLFLFSDHGVRIDKKEEKLLHFSHGLGLPVNRFQYNIPFVIYSPNKTQMESLELVSLLDLYPTALHLAKILSPLKRAGNNLIKDHSINRSLILSSAISSLEPENGGVGMIPLIKNGHFNSNGEFFFSKSEERRLLEQRAIAYLQLPYRLILTPKNSQLFDEIQDPFHNVDLSLIFKEKELELKSELCSLFQFNPCPTKEGITYSRLDISPSVSEQSSKQRSNKSPKLIGAALSTFN